MRNIFVGSDSQICGKTIVTLCLALEFNAAKHKAGCFKPYGTAPVNCGDNLVDYDALSIATHMKLKDSPVDISPILLTHDFRTKVLKGESGDMKPIIHDAYKKVSKGKDVMLIEGGRTMEEGRSMGYPSIQLIEDLDCELVYVERYEEVRGLDNLLAWKERLGDKFKGVIFNKTDPDHVDYINKFLKPYLEKAGAQVIGLMIDDPLISAVTVSELAEATGGTVVSATDKCENMVHNFLIGAMNLESASSRFRKLQNKAVITGGDRTDLQIAALGTSTRCLILTGGIHPHPMILAKAEETEIPIIVAPHDTMTTMEIIDGLVRRPHLRQSEKIERARKLFARGVDMKKLGI